MSKKIISLKHFTSITLALLIMLLPLATTGMFGIESVSADNPGPTYTLFGNQIPFTLADANATEGLKLSSEVLADGTQAVENIGAGPYTLQLTDNATPVKNFKMTYKYYGGALDASDYNSQTGVYSPVSAMARVANDQYYCFATDTWTINDITFRYQSSQILQRDQWGGGSIGGGWHTVQIMMLDDRAVILFDGIRWYDGAVSDNQNAGNIMLNLQSAGTKIAGVVISDVTADDLAKVIDVDFSTNTSKKFPMWYKETNPATVWGTVDTTTSAIKVASTGTWANYYTINGNLSNSPWTANPSAHKVKNYTLETQFMFDSSIDWQRGLRLILPGAKIDVFGSYVEYTVGTNAAVRTTITLNDVKFHKLRIVCKDAWMQIIIDDANIINVAVPTDRQAADIQYAWYFSAGAVYLKNFQVTDNTDQLVRKVVKAAKIYGLTGTQTGNVFCGYSWLSFVPSVVGGLPALTLQDSGTGYKFKTRENTSYTGSADSALHVKFYVKDQATLDLDTLLLDFKLKNSALEVYIGTTQFEVNVSGYTAIWKQYSSYFGSANLPVGRWLTLDIIVVGNYVVVNFDGKSTVVVMSAPFAASDATTTDTVNVGAAQARSGGLSFTDVCYMSVDSLKNVINTIDQIGTVVKTTASASAIDSAANSYSVLGKAECVNVANYNTLKTDMQSYGSLTGGADVNLDTNTDIKDLVALKKITANVKAKTFMADVNGDGSVDSADVCMVKNFLLGVYN